MARKPRHAEIAGAGYAGLTAAAALAQRGWSVRVHEMAPTVRAFGAGIYLWENGLRVLDALGCLDQVLSNSHDAPQYSVRNADGVVVRARAFGPEMGTRMIGMTRQVLHEALLGAAQAAGAEVRVGSHIVAARSEGALVGEDGTEYPADLAIGADGVGSAVRDSIGLLDSRKVLKNGAIRMLVPRLVDESLGLGDDVVTFVSDAGPRVLCTPCNGETLYLAFMSTTEQPDLNRIPLDRAGWKSLFPNLAPLIESVGDQGRWDVYQVIRLTHWSRGHVALLGDAAHGLPPSLGQGAGLSMMNALSLAVALDDAGDIPAALAHWEATERPLTDHTQNLSYAFVTANDRFRRTDLDPWSDDAMRTARHRPTGAPATASR